MKIGSYVELYRSGELTERVTLLHELLASCRQCPHICRINRLKGEIGICNGSNTITVASYAPHMGEEPPLVGYAGSGTIFFGHCNLKCTFCQNYDISQNPVGYETSPEELAKIMISLQQKGCHNINLVSPTHYIAQIMEALLYAAEAGLYVPLVYNTGGYESLDILRLLDGVIDIYMPDMKYDDPLIAHELSGTPIPPPREILLEWKEEYEEEVENLVETSAEIDVPYIDLTETPIDRFIGREISQDIEREYCMIPIRKTGIEIQMAMADPYDVDAVYEIQGRIGLTVDPVLAPESEIEDAIQAVWERQPLDYVAANRIAVKEMYRQVGNLAVDEDGIAEDGLIIRHLVLPNGLAGTRGVMHFIATEISKDAYVNIMAQYRPEYEASENPLINRPVTEEEMEEAFRIAKEEGLHRFA